MNQHTRLAPLATLCLSLSLLGLTEVTTASASQPDDAVPSDGAGRAPIGPWRVLSADNSLTHQADLLRVRGRLHVVWSQTDAGGRSVRTRILDRSGTPAGPVHPVTTGWLALIDSPQLVAHDGEIVSVFAGIRNAGPSPFTGPAVHASSPDGETWNLQPGALSQTTAAGNETTGIDVARAAGEPLFAMGDFGQHVTMHRGIDSDPGPSNEPDFTSSDSNCCPATFVALATDRDTGQTWAAWHNLGANDPADDAGTYAQRVWPRPNGPLLLGPRSRTAGGLALNPGQRVAIAARTSGGTYVAYRQGYPTSRTIRVWELTSDTSWTVRSRTTVDMLALSAAPGGRLWLSWRTVGDGVLHAARTNRAATRLGAVQHVPTPGRATGQYWNSVIEGSAGPLDIVVNAQANGGAPRFYSTRVLPKLSVRATPGTIRQGILTVRVSDAGDAVRGARVTFHGQADRTNARGVATFGVRAAWADGRFPVRATRPGYAGATTRVRVQ